MGLAKNTFFIEIEKMFWRIKNVCIFAALKTIADVA